MQGTCDEKLLTMLGKSKSRQHFALMGRALAWYGDETGYEAVGTLRIGSTRHGVDGRLHRRIQGPFQGRADPQGAGRFAGLRVHHAARLPHVQIQARQPHGRQARGAGPRHPRDPCRFLHGRVRVPQDARPVVGAGLGSGRDRPRPGDERHAGIGNPWRAPRQDARHHQTGEGHGRQARPRGTQVRGGGTEPAARGRHHLRAHGQRLVRLHGVRRRRVRPQDRRMGVRHHHGHRGAAAAGAGTGDIMGRLAWRHGRSRAPFRPWRAIHQPRVTTRVGEFGMLPSAGTVGDSYDNAMAESVNGAYKTELVWRRKPFQDLRNLELATFRWVSWWNSKRLHQSLGYRTPERTETEYYANQAAQAAPL